MSYVSFLAELSDGLHRTAIRTTADMNVTNTVTIVTSGRWQSCPTGTSNISSCPPSHCSCSHAQLRDVLFEQGALTSSSSNLLNQCGHIVQCSITLGSCSDTSRNSVSSLGWWYRKCMGNEMLACIRPSPLECVIFLCSNVMMKTISLICIDIQSRRQQLFQQNDTMAIHKKWATWCQVNNSFHSPVESRV